MKYCWGLLMLCLSACQQPDAIRLATAANLIQPLSEITQMYSAQTGQEVALISGASGLLSTQIQQGAPFDLFISANPLYARTLYLAGFSEGLPQSLVFGNLNVWCQNCDAQNWLQELVNKAPDQKICIPNPELAPYGVAAQSWLTSRGIWPSVKGDLVFGESVGQVNQFIRSKSVTWAITASSARYIPALGEQGNWFPVHQKQDSSLAQTLVILQTASPEAREFALFLQSAEARTVFTRYGYVTE